MFFRITAVSAADQPITARGQGTVEADSVEQAISRFHRSELAPSDLWPPESEWTIEPIEQEQFKRAG